MVKKICSLALCLLLLTGCSQSAIKTEPAAEDGLKIVATVFPAFDLTRAVAGDMAEVQLLLPPGAESHSYEPTPADILAVQDCDLFIYLGGESDSWVETILSTIEMRGDAMRMVDCVELLAEEHVEGMQMEPGHDHAAEEDTHDHDSLLGAVTGLDEHVWTSPKNAAEITRDIGEKLAELDAANGETYRANAESYAVQIDAVDEGFRIFFDGLEDRTIIFGDRFPLRYFAEEYNLDYYAAFPGCSTQTEPSAATIAFLMEKVEEKDLSTIFYIEFSNHLMADSIAEATGRQTAMFHTCHNVSREEIENGATYVSLMKQNLETLKACMK